jgi:hypothetical protein
MKEVLSLLQQFADTPGDPVILASVAEELLFPKFTKLSSQELYIIYITIMAFPNRSIKHGKILISGMARYDMLPDMLPDIDADTPEWIKEIREKK